MYRVYITDGLYNSLGVYTKRYYDVINHIKVEEKPQETEEEIVARTMKNGGLRFKE